MVKGENSFENCGRTKGENSFVNIRWQRGKQLCDLEDNLSHNLWQFKNHFCDISPLGNHFNQLSLFSFRFSSRIPASHGLSRMTSSVKLTSHFRKTRQTIRKISWANKAWAAGFSALMRFIHIASSTID